MVVLEGPAIEVGNSKAKILIQNYLHGFGCSRRHMFESGQVFSSTLGLKSPQNCAGTCESNTPVNKQIHRTQGSLAHIEDCERQKPNQ